MTQDRPRQFSRTPASDLRVVPLAGPAVRRGRPPLMLCGTACTSGIACTSGTACGAVVRVVLRCGPTPSAAAGSRRGARGPRSPGTGGVRPASGWRSASPPSPSASRSWGQRGTLSRPLPASTAAQPRVYVQTCLRPLLLDQFAILRLLLCLAPGGACRGCPIWPTETILPSPAVTSRPPGAKIL